MFKSSTVLLLKKNDNSNHPKIVIMYIYLIQNNNLSYSSKFSSWFPTSQLGPIKINNAVSYLE